MQPQVLGQEHADDVVQRVTDHGIARIPFRAQNRPHLGLGGIERDRGHFGAGAHHVARLLLVKVEHAGQHHAVVLVQRPLRAGLHDEQPQFVGAVHVLVAADRVHADEFE